MEVNKKQVFENFVVGKSNELAYKLCKEYVSLDKPLLLVGNCGVGKTHLLNAIINHCDKKVRYLTCDEFCDQLVDAVFYHRLKQFENSFLNYDVILIDNLENCIGKEVTTKKMSSMVENWVKQKIIVVLASNEKEIRTFFKDTYVVQIDDFDDILAKKILDNLLKNYDQEIVEKYKLNLIKSTFKNMDEIHEALNDLVIEELCRHLKI